MFFYNYVIGTGKMSVGIRLSPKERSGGGAKIRTDMSRQMPEVPMCGDFRNHGVPSDG